VAPYPSVELMNRVGYLGDGPDVSDRYEAAGAHLFDLLLDWVGTETDLDDAAVLDLGCGAGRVLRHWEAQAARGTRVAGVDIDQPSIDWCREHLGSFCDVRLGSVLPPLDFDTGTFDVVYAYSLFTHLDAHWAEWMCEVHRLLRPGGVALITFLGPERMVPILGLEPDGREGMVVWGAGRNWDVGGPVVFHAPWWIEEHWGRAFEVIRTEAAPDGASQLGTGQSALLLRRRPVTPTPSMLRGIDPSEPREADALSRADEIRDVAGPRAFDADHHLAAAVRSTISAGDPNLTQVGLDISSQDDMYLAHLAVESTARGAITSYFSVGLEVVSVLDRVVTWQFGAWQDVPSMLDVGSGYGRVSRFLVHRLSATRLTVADIQPAAVHFQSQTFGVIPLVTQADTITVPADTTYGIVSAVSLFTHLPQHRFVSWLQRLWRLVGPGGVLVFSTHNAEPPPRGLTLDEQGFAFLPLNEIPALDVADYGTTYTSDAYVRGAISAACADDLPQAVERLPRAFGNIQDVYVLSRAAPTGPSLRSEPEPVWGSVDRVAINGASTHVEGWAADPTGSRSGPVTVRVSADGERLPVRTGIKRTDVAAYFQRPWDLDLVFSGWQTELHGDPGSVGRLLVEVETAANSVVVVHDGALPGG
jgi:SAM-dependent methyltransferase